MPRNVCPECGIPQRTPGKLERHLAVHAQLPSNGNYAQEESGLPAAAEVVMSAPEDSRDLAGGDTRAEKSPPASAPASAPDPMIDPFDLPDMPEFETADAPPPVEPEAPMMRPDAVIEPAFSPGEVAALLKMLFDTTAEMAETGPRGRLSDAEANLVGNLATPWINRQVAMHFGNDPEGTKALIGVGIIAMNKAQVYYAAIRQKRGKNAAIAQQSESTSEAAPDYSPRIPDDVPSQAPPVPSNIGGPSAMDAMARAS